MHKTRTQEVAGSGKGLFLLPNKKGGYIFLGDDNFSHFTGFTAFLPGEWTLFKTVAGISLDVQPTVVKNKFYVVRRHSGQASEEFFAFGKTSFYEVRGYEGGVTIDLDMRRIYDNGAQGRIYKIYFERDCIVVEYAKYPDDSCTGAAETFFLIIKGASRFTLLNEWQPRKYPFDGARGGLPERWVYRALRIDCPGSQRLSFTFGRSKEDVVRQAQADWADWDLLRGRLKRFAGSLKTSGSVASSNAVFALESLVVSLNGDVGRTGVFAGFPWFFHFWARDELVSLYGLVLAEKYAMAKDIIFTYLGRLQPDGRLPNMHPASALGSADAAGWLFKRLGDFLVHLERRKLLWEYFSAEELEQACTSLEGSLRALQRHHVVGGLVVNGPQETWMDTSGGVGDVRKGARVEVQALTLASLKTLQVLYRLLKRGNGREFKVFEKDLVARVREVLFVDGMLWDGFDGSLDRTVRPNVFLAAYAYPELLSKKEWLGVFDRSLESLWLDWGGFSSIAKGHPWFVGAYIARENRSYHRGDSWFWVNNLAALVLHRFDPERYRFHVDAVRKASVDELLWEGVLGHCAEVSGALRKSSSGCLAQAWSAAALLELLLERGE